MWLETWNLNTKLVRATDEEKNWLRDYLTFEDASARFKKRDATVRLFNLFNNTFPSGFISLVQKAGKEEGFQVQLLDKRTPPCTPDASADLAWLRDYQREAVDKVVQRGRGILWLPTGAGKTEVAVGLTRALPCRWGFLVHRTNLMDQAAERYEMRGGQLAGRIGEGVWDIPRDCTFVCATFQTLYAGLQGGDLKTTELLEGLDGLIVDECHVLPADSFWKVAMATPNAHFRVGLSGTPLARGDRRSLLAIAALGPVVYRVKSGLLIERGVLARPKVRMVTVTQVSEKKTWQGVYGDCVVRGTPRNRALVNICLRSAKPCFVFVKEVSHGKKLVDMLGKAGINAHFVWGSHSVDYRKSLVKRLVMGHFDVLVCSVIFQEGIDVPELRSVVVGSGGKSVIATLQRLGRGMRVERDKDGNVVEGGDEFEVWDIDDRGNKWLERHSRARRNAYSGEGFETVVEAPAPAATRAATGT